MYLITFAGCSPSISSEIEKTPSITPGTVSNFVYVSTSSPLPTLEPMPEPTAEPTDEPTPEPTEEPAVTYIANENTGKFHYPDCFSIDRMKEHNKWYFTGSRDELIDLGYVPCKKCVP